MNRNSNVLRKIDESNEKYNKEHNIKLRSTHFINFKKKIVTFITLLFTVLTVMGAVFLFLFFRAKSNENMYRQNYTNITQIKNNLPSANSKPHKLITAYATEDKAVLV